MLSFLRLSIKRRDNSIIPYIKRWDSFSHTIQGRPVCCNCSFLWDYIDVLILNITFGWDIQIWVLKHEFPYKIFLWGIHLWRIETETTRCCGWVFLVQDYQKIGLNWKSTNGHESENIKKLSKFEERVGCAPTDAVASLRAEGPRKFWFSSLKTSGEWLKSNINLW